MRTGGKSRIGGAVVGAGLALAFSAWMPLAADAQTGLWGEYWDNTNLNGAPVASQLDAAVDFDFEPGGVPAYPAPLGADDNSARWQGLVEGPIGGVVNFITNSEDGSRIWVDGRLVVDRWRGQTPAADSNVGPFTMVLGTRYTIRMEWETSGGGGGGVARLRWSYAGQGVQAIPTAMLTPKVATPKISPSVAVQPNSITVSITCDHVGAAIFFSTDGTSPPTTPYTGPFSVSSDAAGMVRAMATKASMTNSDVASINYDLPTTENVAPSLLAVRSPKNNTTLVLTFNEPLLAGPAQTAGNYTLFLLAGGAGPVVSAAQLRSDLRTVALTTAALTNGTSYILRVANIQDRATAANTMATLDRAFTHRALDTSLVHYYPLDEATGNPVTDDNGPASGNLQAGSTRIEGPVLGAVDFDGTKGHILLISGIQADLAAASHSVAAWAKTEMRPQLKVNPYTNPNIIGIESGGNDNDFFFGWIHENGTMRVARGDGASAITGAAVNANWHHYVMTSNATTGLVEMYIDGVRTNATSDLNAKAQTFVVNRIGVLCNTTGGIIGRTHWLGALDDVRVYNAILSQAQVYDYINVPPVTNAGPDLSGTVGTPLTLNGATIVDDGLPAPSTLTGTWSVVSQPGGSVVTFVPAPPNNLAYPGGVNGATASFNMGGTYVLRLVGSDGRLISHDERTITISRIVVTPLALTTTEAGPAQTFSVVLTVAPAAGQTVTINLSTPPPAEGTISTTSLVFTDASGVPGGWDVPQVVTVTPVDDFIGNEAPVIYTIVTSNTISGDATYNNLPVPDVQVTHNDNDIPNYTVAPLSVSVTEGGATATFTIVLNTQPTGNVVVDVASTNAEATVAPAQLTFTAAGGAPNQWDVPHVVTVTAFDDTLLDFTTFATLTTTTNVGLTADATYDTLDPADVAVTIFDNEVIPDPPEAWGNCGLLGAEYWLPLSLVVWWRRRRRS